MLKRLFLIILIVFIAGCKSGTPGKIFSSGKQPQVIEQDYHSGTSGLKMELRDGYPPKTIFEGEEFQFVVDLVNEGPTPIDDAFVTLYNFEKQYTYIERAEMQQRFSLAAKDADNPIGGRDSVEIRVINIKMPPTKRSEFQLESCYRYKTEASALMCINPSPGAKFSPNQGCQVRDVALSGGQGAPVVVDKIAIKSIPKSRTKFEMRFQIYVKNKGGGRVKQYNRSCSGKSHVYIDDIGFSNYNLQTGLNCKTEQDKGGRILSLGKNKDGIIYCDIILDKEIGAYTTPITIRLSYGYTSIIKKKLEIKKFGSK